MPVRIFLDENDKEIRREPMKRGRPPAGSYKDEEGNLVCPTLIKTQPVDKKSTSQENINQRINLDNVKDTKKVASASEEAKMTLDEFLSILLPVRNPENHDGVQFLRGVYVKGHWYLDAYKKDLFNSVIPLIVVDPNKNIIRMWSWYGPKKEDEQGNVYYDFEAVPPTYIVKGLLRPEV